MIRGRYFPPRSSRAVGASLVVTERGVELRLDGEDGVLLPGMPRASERLAGVPRKLTFADDGVFEAPPDADVESLMRQPRGFFGRLAGLEKSPPFVATAAIAVVALVLLAYRFGVPLVAWAAAALTPPSIVAAIDRATEVTVESSLFERTGLDDRTQARMQALFDELSALAEPSGPPLRLLLRQSDLLGANAVALPGGTIIVTDDLVELAEADDEIAGVIAHEIGHVRERHSLQQIYRALGLSFMIAAVTGDTGQLVGDIVGHAAVLQTLVYSREFETDADAYSVELMIGAGRKPTAFLDLLDRIVDTGAGDAETGWWSTHPGTRDRRAAVEESARRLGWDG